MSAPSQEIQAIADELARPGVTTGRMAVLIRRLNEISQQLTDVTLMRGLGWGQ